MAPRSRRLRSTPDAPARDLEILAHVLLQLESQQFESASLRTLRDSLKARGVAASRAIRRLHRLVEWHDWQHNPFFAFIAAALLWGTQIAFAIEVSSVIEAPGRRYSPRSTCSSKPRSTIRRK